ncbi:MAG: lytic murein transglycosylase [Angustibacter sp.]
MPLPARTLLSARKSSPARVSPAARTPPTARTSGDSRAGRRWGLQTATASRTTRAWGRVVILTLLLGSVLVAVPGLAAHADDTRREQPEGSAADARREARSAALEVAELAAKLRTAQRRYTDAVSRVGITTADSVLATQEVGDTVRAAQQAQDRTGSAARALYAAGGPLGLVDHVMASRDVGDLAVRVLGVRQLLAATDAEAQLAAATAAQAARRSADVERRAAEAVVTADRIARESAQIDRLIAQATRRLDALSEQARRLAQAEAARRALTQARAGVDATRDSAHAGVQAQLPPSAYFALYRSAAATCPGMDWTLLAAVGQVESGHGRNVGPSSAGAIGPMQFMPATFGQYGVDGDRDGDTDAWSPADAIYSAAHYLCESGAGSPSTIRDALFSYNRAQWYVDLVLGVQTQIIAASR